MGVVAGRLEEFPGIGPAGASVFLREAQAVWPSVAPYADERVQFVRGGRLLAVIKKPR